MSFASYGVSTSQEIDGLELARQVGELLVADVPARRSRRSPGSGRAPRRRATPATGLPSTTRGQSPHASVVCRPTASSRRQISGMSSTRIQCSWMFCRSVMSAVSRANSREMSAMTRSWARLSWPPSIRTRSMKYSSSSSCGSSTAVRPPSMPGLALGVEAPPAEPAAQVLRVDGGEAAVRVDVLDPGPDVERVVVLLDPLVGVERLAVAERPLTLAPGPARCPGRAGRRVLGPGRGAADRHRGVLRCLAVPRWDARARRPARRRAGTTVSGDSRRGCAPETDRSGVVSRPDRSRCARGRSRRGDEPRSGGRQRRSWAPCCHTAWGPANRTRAGSHITGRVCVAWPSDDRGPDCRRVAAKGCLAVCRPALTLAVTLTGLGAAQLWRDELATWSAATRSPGDLARLAGTIDAATGPYYLFMHVWIAVVGDSTVALRVPAVLAMTVAAGLLARARGAACRSPHRPPRRAAVRGAAQHLPLRAGGPPVRPGHRPRGARHPAAGDGAAPTGVGALGRVRRRRGRARAHPPDRAHPARRARACRAGRLVAWTRRGRRRPGRRHRWAGTVRLWWPVGVHAGAGRCCWSARCCSRRGRSSPGS